MRSFSATNFEPFHPPAHLSHAYLQTLLASFKLRTVGNNPMTRAARHVILDTPSGVRLSGYFSPQIRSENKGLAILLHGWEGSSQSTYVLQCGKYLYRNGLAVFRLNFRDHGASHHLNEGLFYATLLREVWEGIQLATRFCPDAPALLVGFSLGGNFVIRIVSRLASGHDSRLLRAVSISPVLDPEKSTRRIDASPLILTYFLRKWRRSLRLKQRIFPHRYRFDDVLRYSTLGEMTEQLIRRYSEFKNSHEYFMSYGITADALAQSTLPLTIVAAADDPIIPVEDFYALKTGGSTELILHPHGGHNGFLEGIFKPAWYDRLLAGMVSA